MSYAAPVTTPDQDAERLSAIVAAVAQALAGRCDVPDGTPLLAAVSGGADSVLLARALAALGRRWPLAAVMFVDHGLRDVSAERACAAATAAELGVPFVASVVTLAGAGNVQAQARQARYAALEAEARERGALVCTGHTLTDQAETVLARLVRGAGLAGLAGIPPRDGLRVRPLLDIRRDQTRAFSWPYVDDPTNAGDDYQRNRLRHHVLPLLRQENPRAEEALAAVAQAAGEELALVDAVAAQLDDSADLRGLPTATVEALLRWRLRRDLPRGVRPRRAAVSSLAQRLVSGSDGAVSLGGGVSGRARRGRLALEADSDGRAEVVAHGPGHYRCQHASLDIIAGGDAETGASPPPASDDAVVMWLDAARLHWPLTLRRWRLGDGGGPERIGGDKSWLLLDGAGKTLWHTTVSHRSDRKVLRHTQRAARVETDAISHPQTNATDRLLTIARFFAPPAAT